MFIAHTKASRRASGQMMQGRSPSYESSGPPLYSFEGENAERDYLKREKAGSAREFEIEEAILTKFNVANARNEKSFTCIPIVHQDNDGSSDYQWIVVVRLPFQHSHEPFPDHGETCGMRIRLPGVLYSNVDVFDFDKYFRHPRRWQCRGWLEARRFDNPINDFVLRGLSWDAVATFAVAVPRSWANGSPPWDVMALQHRNHNQLPYVDLSGKPGFDVSFLLRVSETTKEVESNGLREAPVDCPDAFSYVVRLENPAFKVNLFDHSRHMEHPSSEDSTLPKSLQQLSDGLDQHQKQCYKAILASLSCGIGMIHGPSGTGKTHLAQAIVALAQGGQLGKAPRVLWVESKNNPLTHSTNRIVELYRDCGMRDIRPIRLYNFNHETRYTALTTRHNQASIFTARQAAYAPAERRGRGTDCLAPTLREACLGFYTELDNEQRSWLADVERRLKKSPGDKNLQAAAQGNWEQMIRSTLADTYFISTTPVGAVKLQSESSTEGSFVPDIVICDDASSFTDPMILALLSKFPEAAFLLFGDTSQSRPFVQSLGESALDRWNEYAAQRAVSIMERDFVKNGIWNLKTNHRARAGLHQLASDLLYDGLITSAFPPGESVSTETQHLRSFLQGGIGERELQVPRTLAVNMSGTSFCGESGSQQNHANRGWVMQRINEIVQSPDVRGLRVLVITPYRAATTSYQKAIEDIYRKLTPAMRRMINVPASTIDTAGSTESDIVFLDLVHNRVTAHFKDSRRMAMALTRARHAEIIIMNQSMKSSSRFWEAYVGKMYAHCEQNSHMFTFKHGSDDNGLIDATPSALRQATISDTNRHLAGTAQASGPRAIETIMPESSHRRLEGQSAMPRLPSSGRRNAREALEGPSMMERSGLLTPPGRHSIQVVENVGGAMPPTPSND